MALQVGKALNPQKMLVPAVRTATATGTGIDCSGYEEVVYVVQNGATSGTSPTLDVTIEESATSGGTYTAITGAAAAQITAADKFEVLSVPVNPAKPFQRAVATIAGTTPSFACAVVQLRANPPLLPATAT